MVGWVLEGRDGPPKERWMSAISIIPGILVRTGGLLFFMEWALKPSVTWSLLGDLNDCTTLHWVATVRGQYGLALLLALLYIVVLVFSTLHRFCNVQHTIVSGRQLFGLFLRK